METAQGIHNTVNSWLQFYYLKLFLPFHEHVLRYADISKVQTGV